MHRLKLRQLEFRFYDGTGHIWLRESKGDVSHNNPTGYKKFERSIERATKLRNWLALRCWGYKYRKDTAYSRHGSYFAQMRHSPYVWIY